MLKHSVPLLAALGIVALGAFGCKTGNPRATPPPAPKTAAAENAKAEAPLARDTAGTRRVEILVTFPDGWRAGEQQEGCPSTLMQKVLGLEFSSAHGCVVGTTEVNGPAAKSGLQDGDSIVGCNGGEVSCPSSLAPLLWKSSGNTAKLVVARPVAGTGDSAAADTHGGASSAPAPKTKKPHAAAK